MSLKPALLASAAIFAVSTTSAAAPVNGWYVGVEGGMSWVGDIAQFHTRNAGATSFNATIESDTGWAVLGTAGYAYNRWRFEVEAGYRSNDIDLVYTTGSTFFDADLQEFSLMANVLYDVALDDKISLSLGAGAGFDDVEFAWNTFAVVGFEHDDWGFAYQAIVGLNFAVSPTAELFVNYRYLNVDGPDFAQGTSTFSWDDVDKHAATIGVRYRFGGA